MSSGRAARAAGLLSFSLALGWAVPAHATLDPARATAPAAHHRGAPVAPARTRARSRAAAAMLATPGPLWSLTAPGEPRMKGATRVKAANGLLYVTSYSPLSGGSSLSIVDPATRAVVGSVTDPRLDGAVGIAVAGTRAYVTGAQNRTGLTNSNRLTVVDVSAPATPRILGSVKSDTDLYGAYGVAVSGNLAYVAAQGCVASVCTTTTKGNRLVVVDVGDPTQPVIRGRIADPTKATYHLDSIAVVGTTAFGTAFNSSRLTLFDVADPDKPRILSSLYDPRLKYANDVAVQGNDAFVVDQGGSTAAAHLVAVDVSARTRPAIVGSVADATALNQAYSLVVSGRYAYVASYGGSALTVVDVGTPTQPTVVGSRSDPATLGRALSVDVAGSTAYVAAYCLQGDPDCKSPTTGALTALDLSPFTGSPRASSP